MQGGISVTELVHHSDGLMQDSIKTNVSALELQESYTKPLT